MTWFVPLAGQSNGFFTHVLKKAYHMAFSLNAVSVNIGFT